VDDVFVRFIDEASIRFRAREFDINLEKGLPGEQA
jgi:hypothetical protein